MKNYTLFNKLILHTASAYTEEAIKDGLTKDPLHLKLNGGLKSLQSFLRFSPSEAEYLQSFNGDQTLERIKRVEVSFIVYAMELLRLWVEHVPKEHRKHIYVGIGEKHLKKGRAHFTMQMLELKMRDANTHKEKRQIIDDSVLSAKHYFNYFEEKLVRERKDVA